MSTTPTTSRKRLVALGAVTALAAGVLVPLAATPASAAPPYSSSSVPIRATLPAESGSIALSSTQPLGDAWYGLVLVSQPAAGNLSSPDAPAGYANGSVVGRLQQPASANALAMSFEPNSVVTGLPMKLTFAQAGTYKFDICRVANVDLQPGQITCDIETIITPSTSPIVETATVPVGGGLASFTVSPSSRVGEFDTSNPAIGDPALAAPFSGFSLSYKDSNGVATLPLDGDSVKIRLTSTSPLSSTPGAPLVAVSGGPTGAIAVDLTAPVPTPINEWFAPSAPYGNGWIMLPGKGQFFAVMDRAAIADFTFIAQNPTVAIQTARLSTGAVATTGLALTPLLSKDIIRVDVPGGGPLTCSATIPVPSAACNYWLNTTVTSVPVKVSGKPGSVVQLAIGTNPLPNGTPAAIIVSGPGSIQIEADGTAQFTVTVTGIIREDENFDVVATSGNFMTDLSFVYRTPYPVPVSQVPPAGSTVFATADGKTTVTTVWQDQYGNKWTKPQGVGLFRASYPVTGAEVLVDQGITNAEGVSVLTGTRGSATPGFRESFYVAALVNGQTYPFPGFYRDLTLFNVWYDQTPVLTITKGVSVAGGSVTTQVPGDAYVDGLSTGPFPNPLMDWTPATVQVTNQGVKVPFAAVTFTGSTGVQFVPFCNGPGATQPDVPFSWFTVPFGSPAWPGDPGTGVKSCFYGSNGGNFAVPDLWPWNEGVTSQMIMANADGKVGAQTYTTQTGTNTVTATAGVGTTQGTWTAVTNHWYARNVAVSPASSTVNPGSFSTVTATVTDPFGNVVAGALTQATIPATSIGRFEFGGKQIAATTDASGQAKFDVTASATEVPAGTTKTTTVQVGTNFCGGASQGGPFIGNQFGAAAEQLDHCTAPSPNPWSLTFNDAPGFKASTAPATASVTFDYAALGMIEIKSPKPGSAISSGGYFGVTAVATNVAAGTEVKLTLDGRAKATAKVAADGLIRFEKIPAQVGKYSVRWGTPGAYLYSNEVMLDIKPFGITRFNEGGTARDTFQVATGNWAKGTKIMLTKDGKAVASGRVGKVGQAIAIVYNAGPGTYQVRVDSNQGPVYGLAGGVVVIK